MIFYYLSLDITPLDFLNKIKPPCLIEITNVIITAFYYQA